MAINAGAGRATDKKQSANIQTNLFLPLLFAKCVANTPFLLLLNFQSLQPFKSFFRSSVKRRTQIKHQKTENTQCGESLNQDQPTTVGFGGTGKSNTTQPRSFVDAQRCDRVEQKKLSTLGGRYCTSIVCLLDVHFSAVRFFFKGTNAGVLEHPRETIRKSTVHGLEPVVDCTTDAHVCRRCLCDRKK